MLPERCLFLLEKSNSRALEIYSELARKIVKVNLKKDVFLRKINYFLKFILKMKAEKLHSKVHVDFVISG